MGFRKRSQSFLILDAICRDSINSIADGAFFFTYKWFKTLEVQKSVLCQFRCVNHFSISVELFLEEMSGNTGNNGIFFV
jgi:hypothetical protein